MTYTASAHDDVDGDLPVSCGPPSGSAFAIGQTTVICDAADAAGNEASAEFTVHVRGAGEQLDELVDVIVRGLGLPSAISTQLKAALADALARDPARACRGLSGFITAVSLLERTRRLSTASATELRSRAQRIRAVLACA